MPPRDTPIAHDHRHIRVPPAADDGDGEVLRHSKETPTIGFLPGHEEEDIYLALECSRGGVVGQRLGPPHAMHMSRGGRVHPNTYGYGHGQLSDATAIDVVVLMIVPSMYTRVH